MHACPLGTIMTGFHQDANMLLCQRLANPNLRERLDLASLSPRSCIATGPRSRRLSSMLP